jgi:acyl carrier protein
MTEEEIYAGLTPIFQETFGDDSLAVRPEMTQKDVEGWDSLKMILLIVAVERRFAIKLRSREIDSLRCVDDFAKLIESKTAAEPSG